MFEELLVRHCSPTLAGMKTGSIFNFTYSDNNEMIASFRRYNRLLSKKGLRILPLRFSSNRALVYVYRPSRLLCDLKHRDANCLLEKCGYCTETPQKCLMHLIKRLRENDEFPHEIGLFLGYPAQDVCGFIENKAENCKCIGMWKVYGDESEAKRTFEKYRKCTALFCSMLANGMSIERLTVAG